MSKVLIVRVPETVADQVSEIVRDAGQTLQSWMLDAVMTKLDPMQAQFPRPGYGNNVTTPPRGPDSFSISRIPQQGA